MVLRKFQYWNIKDLLANSGQDIAMIIDIPVDYAIEMKIKTEVVSISDVFTRAIEVQSVKLKPLLQYSLKISPDLLNTSSSVLYQVLF